jgi:hypothetical protein
MFKLKVADAKFLRDMITSISILVDEATFKLDSAGDGSFAGCYD